MSPKIHPAFWNDPHLENVDSNTKFVFLWTITNPGTDILGRGSVSPRRFTFETGLPFSEFQRACQGLTKPLLITGEQYLVRNYIAHQFGRGKSLITNNIFKSICRSIEAVKNGEILRELFTIYPELWVAFESPYQGLTKPKDKDKDKEKGSFLPLGLGSAEGKGPETPPAPPVLSDAEKADAIYSLYPRKVGKPAAIAKILKAISKFDFETVKTATERFAKAWENAGDEIQYCPHPSTWFNQERFNDAPETWDRKSPGKSPEPKSRQENLKIKKATI